MFLGGDGATRLADTVQNGLFVQRLDSGDVDDFSIDALLTKHVGGLQCGEHQMPGGENAHVRAFLHYFGFSDDERLVLFREVRHCGTTETDINGADVLGRRDGRHFGLVVVAGIENHHVGQHLHQSEVFHHLVRCAVLTHSDASVRSSDFDIQVGICHRHADLVIHTTRNEPGECAGERNLAAQCQTCGNADHVGLRDAALDETFRMGCLEIAHLHAPRDIRCEYEDVFVVLRRFYQAGSEPRTGVFHCIFFNILHAKKFAAKIRNLRKESYLCHFICQIFLMKKKLLILLAVFCSLCCEDAMGQGASTWRIRHFTADSMSLRLDSCSIIPNTFQIQELQRSQYRLDPLTATLYLLDSSLLGHRFFVQYDVFPKNLSLPVAHKYPRDIEPRHQQHQSIDYPITSLQSVLNDNELYTNGAISRGVTVGSNQDLVLNSALNLQITGKLSEDVEIMASVSDKNIPIQPEGNTQTLQDISSVFIALKIKEMATINAGDVLWSLREDRFLRVSRNMLGLDARVISQPKQNLKMTNQAGGGMAKGRFARQYLTVQNGVQGPYKLYGADGELSIVIVAGSERVYIDGQLLTRGADNDYVVDYNTAEITFTPQMLVSVEKRVIVEFEYTNRHYSRYNLFTHNELELKGKCPLKLYVNFFHEQDLKNQSIQPELTNDNKRFLAALGDAGATAYYPTVDTAAFSPDRILYEKKDSIYNNNIYTIYKYSNNFSITLYSPSFTYMGTHKGNYRLVSSTANGRVFEWVAPENDVPQGEYEPVLTLTAPTSQQMATIGLDFSARNNTRIQAEFALSHYDQNTFSKKDREDDVGFSYFLNVSDMETLNSRQDSLPWLLTSQIQMQFVHKNFTPFESFREVEFARQFNLSSDYSTNSSDWLIDVGINLTKRNRHQLLYHANFFDRVDDVFALRNELTTSDRWKNWWLKTQTSFLLTHDSIQRSRYLVSSVSLSKNWKKLVVGLDNLLEHNVFRDTEQHSLRLNSYAFNELNATLGSAESAKHRFLFAYKNRVEFAPDTQHLHPHLMIHEAKAQYRFAQIRNQSFTLNATYRHQTLMDSLHRAEHYFVGDVQYTGRFFKNVLILNMYYQTGSGMELKKTFTYVKVAAGQGTHVWKDYNGNGIEELDEFEVALFPDEAEYIKVWIAGTEYVNVYESQWSQSVQLRPAAVWGNKKGFRKFLSRFQDVLALNTSLKHKSMMFNPFPCSIEDTNLVADRMNLTNTFSFNNSNAPFAFDFIVQKTENTQFLYYGLESNNVDGQEVVLKSTPVELLYLQTSFQHRKTQNSSNCFTSRQYLVEAYSVDALIQLQYRNKLTGTLSGQYVNKRNLQGEEHVRRFRIETSWMYRWINKGTFSLSAEYVFLKGDVGETSAVSYFLLDGLSLGRNLLWTANVQVSVSQFLQLMLQYQGRAMQGHAVIHTGSITVNALF